MGTYKAPLHISADVWHEVSGDRAIYTYLGIIKVGQDWYSTYTYSVAAAQVTKAVNLALQLETLSKNEIQTWTESE